MHNTIRHVRQFPFEAALWLGGLLALMIYDPSGDSHFTICPLYHLGFDFCPGCGLGKSISYFFHGEISRSFATHPMGMAAVVILIFRNVDLIKKYLQHYGKSN